MSLHEAAIYKRFRGLYTQSLGWNVEYSENVFFFLCYFNMKNGPSKSKRLYMVNYLEEICLFYCSQSNFTLQIIFIYSDRACNVRNVCFPSTGPIVICRCRWPMFTRDHSLDCSEILSLHLYALISVRALRECEIVRVETRKRLTGTGSGGMMRQKDFL